MKIIEVIEKLKKYHQGTDYTGNPIDESKTRDKILYGDGNQECTGIVTTCWASMDVINKAYEKGANLIICHEALFWNHGDHTDWLIEQRNQTFLKKKKLLDETGIVVWRDHDYIHSGIPIGNNQYTDGIFYGVIKELGWEDYLEDTKNPFLFRIPETTAKEVVKLMINKFNLNGAKMLGNPNNKVTNIYIYGHVMGEHDNMLITKIEQENINLVIALELIDYTVSEYIRDASMQGQNKSMITLGHFNIEEPGMKYMVEYITEAVGEQIVCQYIQSGDMYYYM